MLFLVRMDVTLPTNKSAAEVEEIIARERAYSQDLQRRGKWLHLYRVAGEYANYSVFDVESNDELHGLLWELPLFPYMKVHVTPLAKHPSSIR